MVFAILPLTLMLIPNLSFATAPASHDLDASIGTAFGPIKDVVNKYYSWGIFISGVGGALLQNGDLRERMVGLGKGALLGGIIIGLVKSYLGV